MSPKPLLCSARFCLDAARRHTSLGIAAGLAVAGLFAAGDARASFIGPQRVSQTTFNAYLGNNYFQDFEGISGSYAPLTMGDAQFEFEVSAVNGIVVDQGLLSTNAPEPMTIDFGGSPNPVFALAGIFLNTDFDFAFVDGEMTFSFTPSHGPNYVTPVPAPTFIGFLSDVPITSLVIYPWFEVFEYEDPDNPGTMLTDTIYYAYPAADELVIGDTTGSGWAPIPEPGSAAVFALLATVAIPAGARLARLRAFGRG